MESEEFLYTEHFEPVPELFHSTETGRPFERCGMCDRHLLGPDSSYVIEKAFRSYSGFEAREVVFEYALCSNCRDKFTSELSRESLERVRDYFMRRVDVKARRKKLIEEEPEAVRLEPWVSSCLVSGEPVSEMDEFQIFCECDGPVMLYGYSPYLLSGKVMDEIADLLSAKTLDELNGFANDVLGLPPELEELFTRRVVLL
jgi:hypothetical protein